MHKRRSHHCAEVDNKKRSERSQRGVSIISMNFKVMWMKKRDDPFRYCNACKTQQNVLDVRHVGR